ncbi:MAG: molecular chaperone DnaJ [Actinobacteria bacterium]|nr:molecular chaperone DnaJ [Actinomycetota bacterium]
MPEQKPDYYDLLGVDRDADDAAIKKAFRRKARELHPDVNPDDAEAESRFKLVAEAYEVLSNRQTRQMYDRHGHAGLGGQAHTDFSDFGSFQDLFDAFFGGNMFGGGRQSGPRRPAQGQDMAVEATITFAESAAGLEHEVEYDAIDACETCGGSGAAEGATLERCVTCGGQGQVHQVTQSALGQFRRTSICPACSGRGEIPSETCDDCNGAGRVRGHRRFSVNIPAGIASGQQIRVAGRGHAGEPGARPGDLYVAVNVEQDDRFRRDGLDVISSVSIPVTDAMVGTTVTVPTVTGEEALEIRPGTQFGDQYVIRGKGFPALQGRARGDQRVLVEVQIPKVASPEAREAVERLADTLDDRAYRHDTGFFDRLKHAFR